MFLPPWGAFVSFAPFPREARWSVNGHTNTKRLLTATKYRRAVPLLCSLSLSLFRDTAADRSVNSDGRETRRKARRTRHPFHSNSSVAGQLQKNAITPQKEEKKYIYPKAVPVGHQQPINSIDRDPTQRASGTASNQVASGQAAC